jgi:hypothetical protein
MKRIQPQSDPFPTLRNLVEIAKGNMIQSLADQQAVVDGYRRGLLEFIPMQDEERNDTEVQRRAKRFLALLFGSLAIVFLLTLTIFSTWFW